MYLSNGRPPTGGGLGKLPHTTGCAWAIGVRLYGLGAAHPALLTEGDPVSTTPAATSPSPNRTSPGPSSPHRLPALTRLGVTTRGHFDPQVSIVTGGGSGIGRGLVLRLAARGSHVVVADLDLAKASAVAAQAGPTATAASLDVADAAAVRALVDETVARHGRLDLMVNNAGVGIGGLHEQLEQEQWDLALTVNLGGVINGINAAYPVMRAAGRGHILNTASLAGLFPAPTMLPYTMSKHAVVGLSTALRAEAASVGVRVSVLCPGFVDTPLLDEIHTGGLGPGRRTHSMRKQIRFMQPTLVSVDTVVDKALAGLARNQAIIPVGVNAAILWRLNRYAPVVARALSQVQATGARRILPRPSGTGATGATGAKGVTGVTGVTNPAAQPRRHLS